MLSNYASAGGSQDNTTGINTDANEYLHSVLVMINKEVSIFDNPILDTYNDKTTLICSVSEVSLQIFAFLKCKHLQSSFLFLTLKSKNKNRIIY